MKTPLRYQITDFDCGSVNLLNCLTYLFEREELPAELVRVISTYTLSFYDMKGNLEKNMENKSLAFYVSNWINKFAAQKNIPVKCKFELGADVSVYDIVDCLKKGGCVHMKTGTDQSPYVMLTAIDDNYVYLFDPCFKSFLENKNSVNVQAIDDNPFGFNRRVTIEHFLSEKHINYAIGPVKYREALILKRNDALLARELG